VGYVGLDDLFTGDQEIPCVMMSFEESPESVQGETFEVTRNPKTFQLEVKMREGVKLRQHSQRSLNASTFNVVVLVDEQGKRYNTVPKKYR